MAYWSVTAARLENAYATRILPKVTKEISNDPMDIHQHDIIEFSHRTLATEYNQGFAAVPFEKGRQTVDTNKNTIKNIKKEKTNPFQRGKTWTIILYPPDPLTGKVGKPKWVGGFKTEAEAKAALRKAQAEIELGTYKNFSSLTLGQYLQQWFDTHSHTLAQGTARGYDVNIKTHILPHIGSVKLQRLDRHMLTRFYFELQEKHGLSPASVRYVHATIRKALNDAVADDLLTKNPAVYAVCPKGERFHPNPLTKEQASILLKGVLGSNIETPVLLMLSSGLRRGEAMGLRFQDVDFERKTIAVVQQVTGLEERKGQPRTWGIKALKTDSSVRKLYVPDYVLDSIKSRKKEVASQKLLLGAKYQDNDLICCNEDGSPKNPQTVYHKFKKILKDLSLPDVRLHDLRHTCASLLLEQDVPLKVISETLGHSTISITADTYITVMEKAQQPVKVMEGLFGAK